VRTLVTGAAGQLGVELFRTAPPSFHLIGLGHRDCDITDRAQVDAAIGAHRPNLVINVAAYTAVDDAESASDLAYAVNATGAGNLARAAEGVGARIIHISTDYVFDGASREPFTPESPTHPINVYGASKLAGEQEVQGSASSFLIIRSSWLYASHGKNFLRTILSALKASRALRVVDDQIGVPTSARSLALTIWACAQRSELAGIHHWVDGETASWYDFAVAIQAIAIEQGHIGKATPIVAVTSEEYRFAARRPPYSVLDARGLSRSINRQPRPWRSWLTEVLDEVPRPVREADRAT
jgi:dTDP-4-dehydrorhamnose reductase